MNAFKRFWYALHGYRVRPVGEPDFMGERGLSEQDAVHIASTVLISKWADVEYIGPGAAEAEARRTARLNPDLKESAQVKVEKPKRQRLSKAERLQRKLERLRAEVEKLEKGGK